MDLMASLIPGYEYEIFINYRQKDNQPAPGYGGLSKGDRWMSEFNANPSDRKWSRQPAYAIYFNCTNSTNFHCPSSVN
jgi:hypothetical protein